MQIKITGVQNLTDARYFAAQNVDWLGFDLDPSSEHAISPQKAKEIAGWVEGVPLVGEFGVQGASEIGILTQIIGLEAAQVGIFHDLEEIKNIENIKFKSIIIERTTTIEELLLQFENFSSLVPYFELDFTKNNIYWEEAQAIWKKTDIRTKINKYPVFWKINIAAENINEFIQEFQPFGLSLQGGEEEKIGFKSFDELDSIFEILTEL